MFRFGKYGSFVWWVKLNNCLKLNSKEQNSDSASLYECDYQNHQLLSVKLSQRLSEEKGETELQIELELKIYTTDQNWWSRNDSLKLQNVKRDLLHGSYRNTEEALWYSKRQRSLFSRSLVSDVFQIISWTSGR